MPKLVIGTRRAPSALADSGLFIHKARLYEREIFMRPSVRAERKVKPSYGRHCLSLPEKGMPLPCANYSGWIKIRTN